MIAIYEKIQKDANPGLNKTLKDKYYKTFGVKPLMCIKKIENIVLFNKSKLSIAKKIYYDKMISEIIIHLDNIPSILNIHDQGYYIVGYYHQNNNLYTKKENK